MLALLSFAHASSCISLDVFPSSPHIESRTLGTASGALFMHWRNAPDDVGMRFRLRGPDDALVPWRAYSLREVFRFEPIAALAPGTYTVEHLHQYEAGRYTLKTDTLDGTWYPVDQFDVAPSRDAWDPEVESIFTRNSDATSYAAAVSSDAWMYGVEIDGVGEVQAGPIDGGYFEGTLWRYGTCVDPFDVRAWDRFRLRLYGSSGRTYTGPWVTAEEAPPFEGHVIRLGAGKRTRRAWDEERVTSDARPASSKSTECGGLELSLTYSPKPLGPVEPTPKAAPGKLIVLPFYKGSHGPFYLPEGELKRSPHGFIVEDKAGRTTPAVRWGPGELIQRDGYIELLDETGEQLFQGRLSCASKAVGFVPFEK